MNTDIFKRCGEVAALYNDCGTSTAYILPANSSVILRKKVSKNKTSKKSTEKFILFQQGQDAQQSQTD